MKVMQLSQYDFITIEITVSAKHHLDRKEKSIIILLTLSATQLRVSKRKHVTSSQQFTSQLLGKCKQVLF